MPEPIEIGEIGANRNHSINTETPTMELKYINGDLHQKWIKTRLTYDGHYDKLEEIWKIVPREGVDDENDST